MISFNKKIQMDLIIEIKMIVFLLVSPICQMFLEFYYKNFKMQ